MKTYRLTVERGGTVYNHKIRAENDLEATIDAVARIMQRARGDEVWAKGAITLYGPDGAVLQEMKEKP